MALTSALNNALSGLRFTGVATSLAGSNVANATNPGYVRKRIEPVTVVSGDQIGGIQAGLVRREYDSFVQRQLFVERANGAYATTRAQALERLDQAFGKPGAANALDTVVNEFAAAVQALQTTPESASARTDAVGRADVLAQTLRSVSTTVQGLRQDAEQGLQDAANALDSSIASLNGVNERLRSMRADDPTRATILDQRDTIIGSITELMDVRVAFGQADTIQLYAPNGLSLLTGDGLRISFDKRDALGPESVYDADPARRTVGTLTGSNGTAPIDLIAAGSFRSGRIAALIDLRDRTLPAAQAQLDQIAAGLARSTGSFAESTPVSIAGPGPSRGFDMLLGNSGLADGDTVTLDVSINGVAQRFTFKRVDDPALAVDDQTTPDSTDRVVRLTGSSSATHAADIQTALDAFSTGAGAPAGSFAVSVVAGKLRVLADGSVANATVSGAEARITARSPTDGLTALPLFVDPASSSGLFSDRVVTQGSQAHGFASRITIAQALRNDPASLVVMSTNPRTDAADPTRPAYLSRALNSLSLTFQPTEGLGSRSAPVEANVISYMRMVITTQGQQAATAIEQADGQKVVVQQLETRFQQSAAVNIDEEMAQLIQLQNAYGANARVMSAVREMFDMLRQV